ncbi:MAG: glycoside hydrolase family 3 C-terminal domain-containing protein [Chitinispirillaceae bacterium]|nr:glycoside hydrolase family 3 C-terminal domain-containing protein [Chitinispirillaceae bacterium]
MRFTALICILFTTFFSTTVSAQTITGKVVDKKSKPIAGASLTLKTKGTTATTGTDGTFSIQASAIRFPGSALSQHQSLQLNGQTLFFNNDFPQNLRVELYDVSGKRAGAVFSQKFGAGSFSLPLSSLVRHQCADGLYIVRIVKGDDIHTLTMNPFSSASKSTATAARASSGKLVKQTAVTDTLIISKTDYVTVKKAVNSDEDQDLGEIMMELVKDPDAAVEKSVDSLLALMTTNEKIAQTAEVLVDVISTDNLKTNMYGSVFNGGGCPFPSNAKESWASNLDAMHDAAMNSRLGIPILYGIDAVHGNATIEGATVFPHNIGMGCTDDTALVAKMASITAKECRAVGINLNYGPAISVVRNERWGRSYEGYGETPEINAKMAAAYVRGLQGNGDLSRPDAVAACAKHFIGDGGTTDGVNGGVTELSEETMRAVHLPPYKAAISEGVASVMPSYNAWKRNGTEIRCTNDKYSLTDLLKTELKWDGFCLSDWDAIPQISAGAAIVYTKENVSSCINAGIDMAMIAKVYEGKTQEEQQGKVTDYIASMKEVAGSTIPTSRLDDAVKRILRTKFRMGLFKSCKSNASLLAEFGSESHRSVARECVQKSMVLLKNESGTLPLRKTEKIVVVGPYADKIGAQCGGWTISWQGNADEKTIKGTTILKGLQDIGGSNVTFDATGTNISSADKIVLVIGEAPYAEGQGDHGHKNPTGPGAYIDCPQCDLYKNKEMSILLSECPNADLLSKCFSSNKPVIVVLLSGRPMIITDEIEKSKAFVAAWLPGSEGAGVADVLFGDKPFSGKLKHTWPKTFDQIPINSGTAYNDEKKGNSGTPLFEFGYGLTY